MEKKELLCDGNIKQVYATDEPDKVIIRYKDIMTAFNGIKRVEVDGKAAYNNKISAFIFKALSDNGIESHFLRVISDEEQLCRRVNILPLEVIVRNYAAGTMVGRLGIEQGTPLTIPVYELCYNNEKLYAPLINEGHAVVLGIASLEELSVIKRTALKINEILLELFRRADIRLVDFKIEFGRLVDSGQVILSDEISLDTCRLWDINTGEVLDKDRFRYDLGEVFASYSDVYDRLMKL